jgi:hypothetical protein
MAHTCKQILAYLSDAGFAGMQMLRVIGSGRLPLRFQWKAWEDRQCVVEYKSSQVAPGTAMFEVMRVKPKLQWRPQKVKDAKSWNACQGRLQAKE